jgi:hypothetical protein
MILEADLGTMLCLAFPVAFPRLLIFRRQILNVETAGGWRARAGVRGQADYYVMGPRCHVEVETKAARPKWYKEQIAWRDRCVELGIPYLIARAKAHEDPEVTVARWLDELRQLCT